MATAEGAGRREFLISRVWIQAVLLVVLCGFFVLGLLAYRTYMAHPPVPARVVDAERRRRSSPAATSAHGQQVFLHNGLMEYGSAFGHGAYLGPDYTADYLRRASNLVRPSFGGPAPTRRRGGRSRTSARTATTRRPHTLTFSAAQAAAFRRLVALLQRLLLRPARPSTACRPGRDHRSGRSCGS